MQMNTKATVLWMIVFRFREVRNDYSNMHFNNGVLHWSDSRLKYNFMGNKEE